MAALGIQNVVPLLADNSTLIVTLLSIFAGSLAAGLAGFAFSAISGAILFHWLTPLEAVPLLLACSITTQLVSIARLWPTMQWRRCLPYLGGGLAGIPVGTELLKDLDPSTFAAWFGAFLVSMAATTLFAVAAAFISGESVGKTIIAFAPGGLEAMIILAFLIGLDPAFVGAHHIARFVLISLFLPIVARLLFGRAPGPDR